MRVVSLVAGRQHAVKAAAIHHTATGLRGHTHLTVGYGVLDRPYGQQLTAQLQLPRPAVQLPRLECEVGIGRVGALRTKIRQRLVDLEPDRVVVYGDLWQSVSAGLAANDIDVPVVHVEAGLRSFDPYDDEEQHREHLDSIAALHVTHSDCAAERLGQMGVPPNRIMLTAPPAITTLRRHLLTVADLATRPAKGRPVVIASLHRRWNLTSDRSMRGFLGALVALSSTHRVVLIAYPTTREAISTHGFDYGAEIETRPTLDYHSYLRLLTTAAAVITDSSGIQDEAFFLGKPLLVMRRSNHRTGRGAIPLDAVRHVCPTSVTSEDLQSLSASRDALVSPRWEKDAGVDVWALLSATEAELT